MRNVSSDVPSHLYVHHSTIKLSTFQVVAIKLPTKQCSTAYREQSKYSGTSPQLSGSPDYIMDNDNRGHFAVHYPLTL